MELAGFLTVQDVDFSLATDPITLSQAHVLVVADSQMDFSIDGVSLGLHLLVQEVDFGLSVEAPVLSTAIMLAVQDALMSLSTDGIDLSQVHSLVVSDALFSLAFESASVISGAIVEGGARLIEIEGGERLLLVESQDGLILVASESILNKVH